MECTFYEVYLSCNFFPDEDCVGVHFYDAENRLTFGRTLAEAIDNAEDVLNFALWSAEEDGDEIPKPTALKDVVLKDHESVMMIHADTETYAEKMATMNFDDENFEYADFDDDFDDVKKD